MEKMHKEQKRYKSSYKKRNKQFIYFWKVFKKVATSKSKN